MGLPAPKIPPNNQMTPAKVALGQKLFFDTRLSADHSMSCASCHQPARAFTDGKARATGIHGDTLNHNTMALVNLAWRKRFGWQTPEISNLEEQMLRPLFATNPVEMGLDGIEAEILSRFDPEEFRKAYPGGEIAMNNIIAAIASYERTLVSATSAFDTWYFDGVRPSDDAVEGLHVFRRAGCGKCHQGIFFASDEPMNNGTGDGNFLVPTLRNLGYTAPYMHDGRFATLQEVLDHYGSEATPDTALISQADRQRLLAFLSLLDDPGFVQRAMADESR